MTTFLRRWGPSLVVMGLIFFFSSRPGDDLPRFGTWDFFLKKGGHLFGYGLLGAAYRYGLTFGKPLGRWGYLTAVALAACYAASDEWHQRFVPGRGPSLLDVGIDTVGAALGAWWVWWRGGCHCEERSDAAI